MDPEMAARLSDLSAIVLTLAGLVVLLALGWLFDDPAIRAAVKAWWSSPTPQWCKFHARPFHECRDQHKLDD